MLFEVTGLSKRFGAITALSGVGFGVREGEILGLIGPNGAGKSTLFECLAGALPADSGAVSSHGRLLEAHERAWVMFYMPEGIAPWPAQSVSWALDFTIGFFRGAAGLSGEVVERLGLAEFIRQPIGELSKGQRKRALLAVALLTPQPALLIDEPFDGLDLRQARDAGETLRAHAARGRTLFLSIHQISDAARLCDRFVLLSGGCVRGEGTVAELAALARRREPSRTLESLEDVFLALT